MMFTACQRDSRQCMASLGTGRSRVQSTCEYSRLQATSACKSPASACVVTSTGNERATTGRFPAEHGGAIECYSWTNNRSACGTYILFVILERM